MLVNAHDMVHKARQGGYAVAHININNLEWTRLVLEVAEEQKSPVIIGVSEGAIRYMGGFKTVAQMVFALHDDLQITVPVALHLDHGTYEGTKKAIAAGFTSVMFDGSHFAFQENYAKTKELLQLAKAKNISFEAEVGTIGGEEDGVVGNGELADPKEAKAMQELGIDFLAAGVGNIHGPYPLNWKGLSFAQIELLSKETGNFPLVLHGGTGIPEEQVKKAIKLGIAKINVNTELQQAFRDGLHEYFQAGLDQVGKGYDPRKILKPGVERAKDIVRQKMQFFGSVGKC